jgi:hypothetical protein
MIDAINSIPRFKTLLSCCGHFKYPMTIVVKDRITGQVFEWFSHKKLPNRCKNGKIKRRYYKKDEKGIYHLDI